MPKARQEDFFDLVEDLRTKGPIQKGWSHFSPLDAKKKTYHCHLGYRWELEVYYAGSREKAPY